MNFATIKAVHDDGVTLAFDDGSESQSITRSTAA